MIKTTVAVFADHTKTTAYKFTLCGVTYVVDPNDVEDFWSKAQDQGFTFDDLDQEISDITVDYKGFLKKSTNRLTRR